MCGHVDGAGSSAAGSCCAGTDCCPAGSPDAPCQTVHDGGRLLGVTYYDCAPVDAHTIEQATLAAHAWAPGAQISGVVCDPSCLCVSNGSSSAVWCYAGSTNAGLGALSATSTCAAAQCPVPGFASTFPWH
jgi:hypothetical protein